MPTRCGAQLFVIVVLLGVGSTLVRSVVRSGGAGAGRDPRREGARWRSPDPDMELRDGKASSPGQGEHPRRLRLRRRTAETYLCVRQLSSVFQRRPLRYWKRRRFEPPEAGSRCRPSPPPFEDRSPGRSSALRGAGRSVLRRRARTRADVWPLKRRDGRQDRHQQGVARAIDGQDHCSIIGGLRACRKSETFSTSFIELNEAQRTRCARC